MWSQARPKHECKGTHQQRAPCRRDQPSGALPRGSTGSSGKRAGTACASRGAAFCEDRRKQARRRYPDTVDTFENIKTTSPPTSCPLSSGTQAQRGDTLSNSQQRRAGRVGTVTHNAPQHGVLHVHVLRHGLQRSSRVLRSRVQGLGVRHLLGLARFRRENQLNGLHTRTKTGTKP